MLTVGQPNINTEWQSNEMAFAFHKTLYLIWGIFFGYWFLSSLYLKSSIERREPWLSRLLYLALLGLAISLLGFDPLIFGPLLWRIFPEGINTDFIGLALMISGLGVAVWARLDLGRYWSARIALTEDHQLIQTGPYRLVRNPIYLGGLVAVLGTALVEGEARGGLAIVLVLIAFLHKIHVEERWLRERFGLKYIEYQKKVKMLIPFIY